jgi:glucan phosphoethanolaminetransferase (alkaline phosphatase superfamily)
MRRFIIASFVIGFVLNLTGWAGNVFLLGSMWEQAVAVEPPPMHSPFSPLVHAMLQFVSDFVLAFVLCAVYRLAISSWRRSQMILAFICGVIVWLGGVPICYIGLVNGGYLPMGVSIATTILALITFFIVAPLLPVLVPVRMEGERT